MGKMYSNVHALIYMDLPVYISPQKEYNMKLHKNLGSNKKLRNGYTYEFCYIN